MSPGPYLQVIGMVRATIADNEPAAAELAEHAILEHGPRLVIGCAISFAAMLTEAHARRNRMPVSALLDRFERYVLARMAVDG